MLSRAMETIQSDALKLTTVKILGAIEACDWVMVHKLSDRLQELATLGMHRHSIEKMTPDLKTTYQEREER